MTNDRNYTDFIQLKAFKEDTSRHFLQGRNLWYCPYWSIARAWLQQLVMVTTLRTNTYMDAHIIYVMPSCRGLVGKMALRSHTAWQAQHAACRRSSIHQPLAPTQKQERTHPGICKIKISTQASENCPSLRWLESATDCAVNTGVQLPPRLPLVSTHFTRLSQPSLKRAPLPVSAIC